ncbi:hypothetical protein [Sphingobacterium yanglingense]|uniref:Uncharacterized protein n=1 Tax=Sphingobacterium yanglingense TaxID=1437280 RepID=A0A4R6WH56_9SPHI|nr:hypothetical protein [Sphingobacterium yanglingense]TDQ79454.1 hypothetical protein CLV99_0892 [Sphingobacterium yanglingense]
MTKFTTRSIIGNLLVTYVLFPIFYIKDYWGNLINRNYQGEAFQYDSIWPFLDRIFIGFFLFSTVLLLLSLLPYHFIKYYLLYRIKKGYYLKSLLVYVLINLFLVCITGYAYLLATNFGGAGNGIPFIVTLIAFSVMVHGFLYLVVDRYEVKETIRKYFSSKIELEEELNKESSK